MKIHNSNQLIKICISMDHKNHILVLLSAKKSWFHCKSNHDEISVLCITRLVLKPEYFRTIRSMPWLLMAWQYKEPGHQQPWYLLCRVNESLSSQRKGFNNMYLVNLEKLYEMQIYFYVSWNKFRMARVNLWVASNISLKLLMVWYKTAVSPLH